MSENVIDQLKEIIVNDLDAGLSKSEIGDSEPLFEGGLGLDSIVVMELILSIEKRFGMQFDDDELSIASFGNLELLSKMIQTKIA